jgi:hypothetical protein
MPVILAAQEAENRRFTVQDQPQQIVHKTLSQKNPSQKRAGRVVKVVAHLPSKSEALSSNPSAAKKIKPNTWQLLILLPILQSDPIL